VIKKLPSNTDLYEYLLSLRDLLGSQGSQQLAESVRFAAEQATGLSTEFLGESRFALRAKQPTLGRPGPPQHSVIRMRLRPCIDEQHGCRLIRHRDLDVLAPEVAGANGRAGSRPSSSPFNEPVSREVLSRVVGPAVQSRIGHRGYPYRTQWPPR
jgi:hypothetical protein